MNTMPRFLKKGDTIAMISPSGVVDATFVYAAKDVLEEWGYKVLLGKHCLAQNGRFAGDDNQRLSDLVWAFTNTTIDAIFCSRGGYGLIRLLSKLQQEELFAQPKLLLGYSDITVLHNLLAKNCICSVHAPMAKHIAENPDDQSSRLLSDTLAGVLPSFAMQSHSLNRGGKVKGKLLGGNLSVLYSLRGTPVDLDYTDCILVIEDIGERLYHLDRMLTNFKIGGVFDKIRGLVVGQFTDMPSDELYPFSPYEIIQQALVEYEFPICYDFPIGHVQNNFPVLLGAEYELSVEPIKTYLRTLC
jgi:muramoyltetrapeptide carboxypeptidase